MSMVSLFLRLIGHIMPRSTSSKPNTLYVAAALVSLVTTSCATPSEPTSNLDNSPPPVVIPRTDTSNMNSTKTDVLVTGTVEKIADQNDKLAISFSDRAAIYHLERKNPQFDKYHELLTSSLKNKIPIKFQYLTDGQVIVLIESN